jgi:uncharacterized protein
MLLTPVRPVTVVKISDALERRGQVISTHLVVMQDDLARSFRIPVGPCEAFGIRIALENNFVQRPMTHDLICTVLNQLGGEIESILIEQSDGDWQVNLTIQSRSGSFVLAADPGDAIALALRTNTTLYATEDAIIFGQERE